VGSPLPLNSPAEAGPAAKIRVARAAAVPIMMVLMRMGFLSI